MPVATQPFTGTFTADPVHSTFGFAVRHMKVATFRASFGDVEAQLLADDGGLTLEGRADVASVSIPSPPEFREHVVNGAEFFDGTNHPQIVFRSGDIRLDEDGGATVAGELTIRGVTHPVQATGTYRAPDVEDPMGNTRGALELTATVDRRDWGMDWQMPLPKGGDVLGYDVELSVTLELIQGA